MKSCRYFCILSSKKVLCFVVSLHKGVVGFLPEPTISACFIVLGNLWEVLWWFIVTDFKSMMFHFSFNFGCWVIIFYHFTNFSGIFLIIFFNIFRIVCVFVNLMEMIVNLFVLMFQWKIRLFFIKYKSFIIIFIDKVS